MNALQQTIFEIIIKISNTPGAFDYADSVLYGLKNYIARHSPANKALRRKQGREIVNSAF